jgi:DNA-binding MarR family transcriptional regulator
MPVLYGGEALDMNYEAIAKGLMDKFFLDHRSEMLEDFHRFSKGEMFLLHYLCAHPKPVVPGYLSEVMGISTARIATILNSLEAKGLIERRIDTNDRRKILVTITDAGRKQITEKHERMYKMFAAALREMGEDDAKEFVRLVTRFIHVTKQILHDEKQGMGAMACSRDSGHCRKMGGG